MKFQSNRRRSVLVNSAALAVAAAALVGAAGNAVAADPFPTRPIRVIVNSAPGGLLDVVTRLVAQQMGEKLGQQVIVDNRAGGDGLIGIRAVKGSPADGYTLLATAGTIAIQPAVKLDPGYELLKDFAPLGPTVRSPLLMVVAASQPDRSVADFVARAKAQPDKVSFASAGVGTTTHVGAAMFLQQAGIAPMHVPYKGNGAAMPDVMAGRVDMIFEAYGSGVSKVKAGSLRAIGVSSTTRLPGLPDVPTIAEQGYPGYSYYLWLGLLAPAGTPKDVMQKLSETLRAALATRELRDRFRETSSEPMDMTPEEFGRFLERDLVQMSKLVTELKLPKQ